MAKNKQQKKKDREKRVAKKKHLEDMKKKSQEKTEQESQKSIPARSKIMQSAVPKINNAVNANKKSTFTQRRTGG
ncbi:hypothetical protein Pan241w_42440 [Gimesia alba]|uniref:Uncharacterized protein n=1 Tax=Gimesia alba TaxID=2527973 RepID=A0A517RJU6_9PLAN|nr:hypothetical protein [Gimesia alba]QDT44138.1 hypothetical protein Pan241w_42440 [Gimesia alba]